MWRVLYSMSQKSVTLTISKNIPKPRNKLWNFFNCTYTPNPWPKHKRVLCKFSHTSLHNIHNLFRGFGIIFRNTLLKKIKGTWSAPSLVCGHSQVQLLEDMHNCTSLYKSLMFKKQLTLLEFDTTLAPLWGITFNKDHDIKMFLNFVWVV